MARASAKKKVSGSRQKLAQYLRRGHKYMAAGDAENAAKYIVAAWNMDPENFDLLVAVADVLSKVGVRAKALEVLEKALAIHGPKPEVLLVMGNLALELDMPAVMERVYRIYISIRPDDPQGYNNLASALERQDKLDEVISFLQDILPMFPEHAALWNTLGSAVSKRDGYEASMPFYAEAYRLDPNSYNILNNISLVYEHTGDFAKAIEFGEKAITVNPDGYYAHLGLAKSLLAVGELERGWRHYEWRQDPRRAGSVLYTHKIPRWDGRSLEGKRLLVGPEQGVGDEVLFALTYPMLLAEGAQLDIGCDRRLVSLYERSFRGARVGAYVDSFRDGYRYRSMPALQKDPADLFIECGSIPQFRIRKVEDFPDCNDGFLIPDPERVRKWRARLGALGSKPKIGIHWRSGLRTAARNKHYAPIEVWAPIFARFGDKVDFINLQYGDCAEELALVRDKFGTTIRTWEGVDLKNDLETVMALSSVVDLVIGPATAPGNFSFAVGTPTWWLLPVRPWWSCGEDERPPFFSKGRMLIGNVDNPWPGIMSRLEAMLGEFVAG
ncbi:MAG: hypothetical protein D6763_01835 [Alphaproteobacteria bacterium]|nr:MAG: hypothetical protein D6763_01835 [Alphaproteobacteria bacterium]